MAQSIPFGARSTADQVLAGVDLTRKRMVVTGCESDIGLATMKALVANGAHVIGLARTLDDARAACSAAGTSSTPIACDLTDCASIDSAADSICDLAGPLDAIITNTDLAGPPIPTRRFRIEPQTILGYRGHFALVNRLSHRVRGNGGRIVLASSDVSTNHGPTEAITLDHPIDRHFYERLLSYGQAKSANAIYAKELSRRLAPRGVSVNSWDSGSIQRGMVRLVPDLSEGITGRATRLISRAAARPRSAFARCATARFLCEWDFLLKIVAKNVKAYYFIGTSLPSSLHAVVQFIRGCHRHQRVDSAIVGRHEGHFRTRDQPYTTA
jgi:WW domain-containing oxidoreductase